MSPRLSVIVCTHDRADLLADVLSDLDRQDDAADVEVLVVDDGSTDGTAVLLEGWADGERKRAHHQPNAGLATARNEGLRLARGELVAFLDDDVVVPAHWSRAVREAFDDRPGTEAVAGRILPEWAHDPPRWLTGALREYLSLLDLGEEPVALGPGREPFGANFAIRASVVAEIGGFRTDLGRKAGSLMSNEERELFWRLRDRGGSTLYWPDAWVRHRIPAERLELDWFDARVHAQGRSDVLIDPPPPGMRGTARELVRAARAVPIAVKGIASGDGPTRGRLWLRYCLGRIQQHRRATGGSRS